MPRPHLSRRWRRAAVVVLATGLLTGCTPAAGGLTPPDDPRADDHAVDRAVDRTPSADAPRSGRPGDRGTGQKQAGASVQPRASAPAVRPTARPGQLVRTTLVAAVAALRVRPERRTGYDRDLFAHWSDTDRNGCDTREEVLITQNRAAAAKLGDGCRVVGGAWFSYYDQVHTRDASTFDVDHLVPLAEAWDSGAHRWSPARREAFANDLGDRRALIAVSASSNRTKSDADPTTWMPAYRGCVYISSWVAVKTRWQLTVDAAEKQTLARYAAACGKRRTTVRVARVVGTGTADARPSDASTMPAHTGPAPTRPAPTPDPGTGGGAGTDPRFPYCTDAIAAGYGPYVRGTDPEYDWYRDGDGDGVVCET